MDLESQLAYYVFKTLQVTQVFQLCLFVFFSCQLLRPCYPWRSIQGIQKSCSSRTEGTWTASLGRSGNTRSPVLRQFSPNPEVNLKAWVSFLMCAVTSLVFEVPNYRGLFWDYWVWGFWEESPWGQVTACKMKSSPPTPQVLQLPVGEFGAVCFSNCQRASGLLIWGSPEGSLGRTGYSLST